MKTINEMFDAIIEGHISRADFEAWVWNREADATESGYEEGRRDGEINGYGDGFEDGKDEGYADGFDAAMQEHGE